jgi:hypothetical protein
VQWFDVSLRCAKKLNSLVVLEANFSAILTRTHHLRFCRGSSREILTSISLASEKDAAGLYRAPPIEHPPELRQRNAFISRQYVYRYGLGLLQYGLQCFLISGNSAKRALMYIALGVHQRSHDKCGKICSAQLWTTSAIIFAPWQNKRGATQTVHSTRHKHS